MPIITDVTFARQCRTYAMSVHVPSLLVVDDEAPIRNFLGEALQPLCDHLCLVADSRMALRSMESHHHDLLLVDICMPGYSGIELLAMADQLCWDCAVVLMTGHATLEQVAGGLRLQAADLLLKPFSLDSLERSICLAYEKLQKKRTCAQEYAQLASGLHSADAELQRTRRHLWESHRSSLITLIATLEAREYATYSHSFRVRSYAIHLARLVAYPTVGIANLAYAALLHDIGKIAVSDSVLLKPGPLTVEEFELLKTHSIVGEKIVSRMGFMETGSKIIRHHHEHWDGRGYPDGLSGATIPLGSRLFAVADTLDAMTSHRCYRKALSLAAARAEIMRCSGTQFDPQIAEVFCSVPDDAWQELRRQADRFAKCASVPEISTGADALDSRAPVE
jgi:putative nucleotidyltransferase with HDIG domain